MDPPCVISNRARLVGSGSVEFLQSFLSGFKAYMQQVEVNGRKFTDAEIKQVSCAPTSLAALGAFLNKSADEIEGMARYILEKIRLTGTPWEVLYGVMKDKYDFTIRDTIIMRKSNDKLVFIPFEGSDTYIGSVVFFTTAEATAIMQDALKRGYPCLVNVQFTKDGKKVGHMKLLAPILATNEAKFEGLWVETLLHDQWDLFYAGTGDGELQMKDCVFEIMRLEKQPVYDDDKDNLQEMLKILYLPAVERPKRLEKYTFEVNNRRFRFSFEAMIFNAISATGFTLQELTPLQRLAVTLVYYRMIMHPNAINELPKAVVIASNRSYGDSDLPPYDFFLERVPDIRTWKEGDKLPDVYGTEEVHDDGYARSDVEYEYEAPKEEEETKDDPEDEERRKRKRKDETLKKLEEAARQSAARRNAKHARTEENDDDTEKDSDTDGSGMRPDNNVLQQMATASYSDTPSSQLGTYQLVFATPTLKFYKSLLENTIIVAIRGTKPTDPDDIKADAMIGLGMLEKSARYAKDLQTLQSFQQQYPSHSFDYYGVGHSLGGAILDMFLKAGLLKNGISYNPAIQPGDFQANLPNSRIYQQGDPLYELMGKHATNVEVRPPKKRGFFSTLFSKVPYAGRAYQSYQNHALDNFIGGVPIHKRVTFEHS